MRTLTVNELQQHIDVCLWRLRTYIDTGRWTYESSATSLAEAEESLSGARKIAKRMIRVSAKYPSIGTSSNVHWITYVLTAESWRFVLWLRDDCGYACADLQLRREEVELLLLTTIGVEIKRLGFQLDM